MITSSRGSLSACTWHFLFYAHIMHVSFASPVPRYPGTSSDRAHICSLEADKSPSNVCRLPRRAGHLQPRVTDKVLAPIPRDIPKKVPAQISSPNDHHQATAATSYMFPAGRDVSMHTSPTLSRRVPRYCPGTREPGIQMIGAWIY